MKSLVYVLCLCVARAVCQNSASMLPSGMSPSSPQARAFNDSRISQQDQELRNSFINSQGQLMQLQDPSQRSTGAAIVPAVPIPAGSTIYAPAAPQQAFLPVSTGQSDGSLLKLLGSDSFRSILQPKMLSQQDATQNLIPPLITDGMQKTLSQQQAGAQQPQSAYPQQQGYNGGYPQQGGMMDPRQANLYGTGAGYPQQYGQQYPQQQLGGYGAQPAFGGYGSQPAYGGGLGGLGSQLYPQTASAYQQPLAGQYGAGLGNGILG